MVKFLSGNILFEFKGQLLGETIGPEETSTIHLEGQANCLKLICSISTSTPTNVTPTTRRRRRRRWWRRKRVLDIIRGEKKIQWILAMKRVVWMKLRKRKKIDVG
jgi:hypothetical protein